jgi:FKBP-type peptidyl-prolyl cis-trans isomerase
VRRAAIVLLALTPLVAAACTSGDDGTNEAAPDAAAQGDDANDANDGNDGDGGTAGAGAGSDGSTSTSVATSGSAPVTSAAMPAVDPEQCEDVPDPRAHPLGEMPTVLRPCSVPSELQVNVIHEGTGRAAENGDTLIVDYTGVLSDNGNLFDTSYLRGIPFDFVLGRGGVILGWDIGLLGTSAGEVVKLDVPGDLAYANNPPSDDIPADAALTFVVEVRAVVPPTSAEEAPLDLLVGPSDGATVVGVVDQVVGDGPPIQAGDTAVVHVLLVRGDNLTVLLNTWEQSDPLQVVMADNQSLPGVITGLEGATVGTTRVITIPPDEAFGPEGEPGLGLPPGVDLIVVAEVVGVY